MPTAPVNADLSPLAGHRKLRVLSLKNARVRARDIIAITSLEQVSLYACDIGDSDLAAFAGHARLRQLAIADARVNGQGFAALADLPLDWLDVAGSLINDQGLQQISKFGTLRGIQLGRGPFTDQGLEHLGSLSELNDLYLPQSMKNTQGVERLRKKLPRCRIYFVR